MKQKRLTYPVIGRRPLVGLAPTMERPGWLQWLAPVVFAVGVGFVLLMSPMALLASMGGFGDCFDAACEAKRQFWADIGMTQAVGWFLAVAALAILAHRINHRVWLVVSGVSAFGVAAGVIADQQGWSTEPEIFGIGIPAISPAFYAWIPGASFMAVGALMIWLAARQARARSASLHEAGQ